MAYAGLVSVGPIRPPDETIAQPEAPALERDARVLEQDDCVARRKQTPSIALNKIVEKDESQKLAAVVGALLLGHKAATSKPTS